MVSLVVGCAKQGKKATESPSGLKKVPITIYVAGDRPKQQDEVLRNIEDKTKDELNISLTVNYIPWSDYANQVKLKASAGQNFDIYLSFFGDLSGNIARKQCMDITSLVDKYGPDLKKQIPQDLWDTLTIDGKIYGVPAVYPMTEMGRGFLDRKDLRLKYNLPEITDQASLEKYLDTIAKNEKGMIPFLGDGLNVILADKSHLGHVEYQFNGMYIDVDKQPYKVENWYKTDVFKTVWEEDKKAMQRGWFEKDILTDTDRDGKFIQGKAAAMAGDLFNITDRQNALAKNVPGGEIELSIINKDGRWVNTQPVNNYAQISSTSKNPERAIMFLNWLRKNPDNYNMYMLGIPGKTYNLKGDEAEVPAGTNPTDRFAPTPWFTMHTPYLKTWTTDPQSFKDALKFWNNLKPEASPLMKFSYSNTNVVAESTAAAKVMTEEGRPISCGLVTSDAAYQKFLSDLDKAGMPKIIEDTQKQLDNFMAKQGK